MNNQLLSTIPQNFTVQGTGYIQVAYTNDGQGNAQTMYVDYAIIDGITYQAEDMPINTGVWNGLSCGGEYNEEIDCPGYIQFPYAHNSITVCASNQNNE